MNSCTNTTLSSLVERVIIPDTSILLQLTSLNSFNNSEQGDPLSTTQQQC